MQNRRKWKNILINPRYQLKYVFWISFTGIVLILANAGVFYSVIHENYQLLVDMSPMEEEVKVQLYRELYQVILALGVFAVVFILAATLFGLILSHRTAGPMYHFKRVFTEIQNGQTEARVRLRPNDDFADVAKACNDMIDYLTRRSGK